MTLENMLLVLSPPKASPSMMHQCGSSVTTVGARDRPASFVMSPSSSSSRHHHHSHHTARVRPLSPVRPLLLHGGLMSEDSGGGLINSGGIDNIGCQFGDEEKDNAINFAMRYQNPSPLDAVTRQQQLPGSTLSKPRSPISPTPAAPSPAVAVPVTSQSTHITFPAPADPRRTPVTMTTPVSGVGLGVNSHPPGPVTLTLCPDPTTGHMILPLASINGQVVLLPTVTDSHQLLSQRTKSPGAPPSSPSAAPCDVTRSHSLERHHLQPQTDSVFTDTCPPAVPPRSGAAGSSNCYENIPVPGLVRRSKSSAEHSTRKAAPSASRTVKRDAISLYSRMSQFDSDLDKSRVTRAVDRLKQSGFYFDMITASDAKLKLRAAQVGTFLVRVSSQASHLFALSVKTNRGTTSIRLTYEGGTFRLDADPQSAAKMPAFECIIALIEFYVMQSASDARNKCVFLESNGRRDTPVILTRPLRDRPQSLQHLCRRNLHHHFSQETLNGMLETAAAPSNTTQQTTALSGELPIFTDRRQKLRQYLMDYPYAL